MKCKLENENKFQPVTISLTFETQEEINAIGTLFNLSPIVDVLAEKGARNINSFCSILSQEGADIHQTNDFLDRFLKTPCVMNRINKMIRE